MRVRVKVRVRVRVRVRVAEQLRAVVVAVPDPLLVPR